MKRAAIITITDYLNYGNRLQNYATQEIIKSYGFEVESIANFPVRKYEGGFVFTLNRIKNAMTLSPVKLIKKMVDKIHERRNRTIYQKAQIAKETSFREYAAKYCTETSFVIRNNKVPLNLGAQYDYFFIGSDQIWNPNIRWGNSFDFAQFAPRHKRIALAPSFGVSYIDDVYRSRYCNWLADIEHLSVREYAGAKLIRELCGRDAQVLMDPTLMRTKEQWLAVAEPHVSKPEKPYLLTYFIGTVSNQRKKTLKALAHKYNLELVQMASLEDISRYSANPGEFIDYIHSASLVCTDSFHAIIFSMLMHKPFVVFDREGKSKPMNSRIDTLLNTFRFEDRLYAHIQHPNDIYNIDYQHFESILAQERNKFKAYLDKILEK